MAASTGARTTAVMTSNTSKCAVALKESSIHTSTNILVIRISKIIYLKTRPYYYQEISRGRFSSNTLDIVLYCAGIIPRAVSRSVVSAKAHASNDPSFIMLSCSKNSAIQYRNEVHKFHSRILQLIDLLFSLLLPLATGGPPTVY